METSEDILRELRIIRALLVADATRDMNQKESIALLSRAGLGPSEIAGILGTTSNTVNVALAGLRKAGVLSRPKRTSTGRSHS